MGSPPAWRRGRLHRQGCSHRLSRRIQAEKKPVAVQGTEYVFDAWIPSSIQVEKLTTDRLNRWHNKLATQPKGVRYKRTATDYPQTRGAPARRPPTESSQC